MNNVIRLGKPRILPTIAVLALAGLCFAVLNWPKAGEREVLLAARDIAAGAELGSADLAVARLSLGDSASVYLSKLPLGAVAVHRLVAGELVAADSVAPSALDTRLATVLELHEALPSAISVGAVVNVWATAKQGSIEPKVIAIDCSVGGLAQNSGLGQQAFAVEVRCEPDFLPQLLAAKAAGDFLAIVPQPSLRDK